MHGLVLRQKKICFGLSIRKETQMKSFETSQHARLLDKLDENDGRQSEYWSKRDEQSN